MPSYLIAVEYVDLDGDEAVEEALVEAANEAEAQDTVVEELEDYFDDADPDMKDECRILRITER